MSKADALAQLTKQPGDPDRRWMTPARHRSAVETLYADRATSPPLAVGRIKCITGWSHYNFTGAGDDQNRMVLYPFRNDTAMTVSDLAMRVATAQAGLSYRIGFYRLDGAGGTPGSLIADCGTFDAASTGIKQINSLSVVLPEDLIAVAMCAQGAGDAAWFQYAVTGCMPTQADFSRLAGAWSQTGVTAGLPATASATDYDAYGPPALWAKRSA